MMILSLKHKLAILLLIPLIAMTFVACSSQARKAVAEEDLPGEAIPILDSKHIPFLGAEHAPYNSVPPTSGPHVPQTVAPGVYQEEIPEEIQTHALEHGHVLLQYAPSTPAEEVRVLEQVARRYSRDVVMAPYSKLESGIALTAWGRLLRLGHADREHIETFVTLLAGRYEHGWQR